MVPVSLIEGHLNKVLNIFVYLQIPHPVLSVMKVSNISGWTHTHQTPNQEIPKNHWLKKETNINRLDTCTLWLRSSFSMKVSNISWPMRGGLSRGGPFRPADARRLLIQKFQNIFDSKENWRKQIWIYLILCQKVKKPLWNHSVLPALIS